MIGFLQQIGPYYLKLNTPYINGDKLTHNQYSWNTHSHLLFLDSPAGVGLSINNDTNYKYNDENTASDAVVALQHFFNDKFSELKYN